MKKVLNIDNTLLSHALFQDGIKLKCFLSIAMLCYPRYMNSKAEINTTLTKISSVTSMNGHEIKNFLQELDTWDLIKIKNDKENIYINVIYKGLYVTEKRFEKKKKKDFIDDIIELFKNIYENNFNVKYYVVSIGKERSSAATLLNLWKKQFPDQESVEVLRGLNVYFNECCNIKNDWYRNHLTLPILVSKINEINKILKNGKSTGTTKQELTEILNRW